MGRRLGWSLLLAFLGFLAMGAGLGVLALLGAGFQWIDAGTETCTDYLICDKPFEGSVWLFKRVWPVAGGITAFACAFIPWFGR